MDLEPYLGLISFYPTAIHGCAGIVFILAGAGGRLDLCDRKLEEVQTRHPYSYHGLVVQRHSQIWVQPLTLTL